MKDLHLKRVFQELDSVELNYTFTKEMEQFKRVLNAGVSMEQFKRQLDKIADPEEREKFGQDYFRELTDEINIRHHRYNCLNAGGDADGKYDFLLEAVYELHRYSESVLELIPAFAPEEEPVTGVKAFEFYVELHENLGSWRNLEEMYGYEWYRAVSRPFHELKSMYSTTRQHLNDIRLLLDTLIQLSRMGKPKQRSIVNYNFLEDILENHSERYAITITRKLPKKEAGVDGERV